MITIRVAQSGTNLKLKGKLWPNQIIAGVPGVLFIGLSLFAFIGAQKIGARLKSMLEDEKVSDEQLVLEEAKRRKIAQGPSGPPQPVAGPSVPHQQNHQADRPMLQQQVIHNQLVVVRLHKHHHNKKQLSSNLSKQLR